MTGLLSNFDLPLRLAAVITIAAVVIAAIVARRSPAGDRFVPVVRVLAVGAIISTVVATLVTRGGIVWGYHQLVLEPGGGGLSDAAVLIRDPLSLPAVQLILNVLLYVPIGLLITLGWDEDGRGVRRALMVGAATTIGVELAQWMFTTRVASTDDVVLNLLGVLVGIGLALLVRQIAADRGMGPAGEASSESTVDPGAAH